MNNYMDGSWIDFGAMLGSYGSANAQANEQASTQVATGSPWSGANLASIMTASMPGFGQGSVGAGAPFSVMSPAQNVAFGSVFGGASPMQSGALASSANNSLYPAQAGLAAPAGPQMGPLTSASQTGPMGPMGPAMVPANMAQPTASSAGESLGPVMGPNMLGGSGPGGEALAGGQMVYWA